MNLKGIPPILAVIFFFGPSFITQLSAQTEGPVVRFKSGDKQFAQNVDEFVENTVIDPQDIIEGYYYRYVQFEAIPGATLRDEIKASGAQLLEYVPHNTYLVAFPATYNRSQLRDLTARSVFTPLVEDKMDHRFTQGPIPDWANQSGKTKVIIRAYPLVSSTSFASFLKLAGFSVNQKNLHHPYYFTELDESDVPLYAQLPFIQFIEIGPAPSVPEDTGGRTLQRSNLINNTLPGGLRYDATGVNVMVRDDGAIGPHIDFEGRVVDFTGGAIGGTHGDGVAGVFAGAGNLDPEVAGSASGAHIYVLNYNSTFTDNTIDLHMSDNVVITNSSYGDGCNAGYTSTTQRVDQQMIDHPMLMHVFSCGNSNGNDCGYGAGPQWGNITGGHKQGKNVMAVANLFSDGSLVSSSSRGPAHDGRIKPDIAAHGQGQRSTTTNHNYQSFGGTSAAAPTMAGTMAQLYQIYREMNGQQDPEAALIKAIILNSAYDMGNRGPDFKFGWGRIDAYQAYKTLSQQSYTSGTIDQNQNQTHQITVPQDVAEARVMVYWRDPAAAINTSRALVNDLDMTLTDPANNTSRPWVLNSAPQSSLLDLPAIPGVDNLNNMEQVSVQNPLPGQYTLNIQGTGIPMGPQNYFVVWTFLYDELKVTYPIGGESFVPGEVERIHWDAYGDEEEFTLAFLLDNTSSWEVFAENISGDTRHFNWVVPNDFTGQALIRITRQGVHDASDGPFTIMNEPNGLGVSDVCQEEANLTWNPVAEATEYAIYLLGEKYMEEIGRTSDVFYTISDLTPGNEVWFAVQAIGPLGAISRRSIAIRHVPDPQGNPCRNTLLFEKFASEQTIAAGDTVMYTVKVTSFYDDPITNVIITDDLPGNWKFIPGSLTCGSFNQGLITIGPVSINPDDSIECSFKVRSDVLLASQFSFEDDLENGTTNWTTDNQEGGSEWMLTTTNPNSPQHAWFSPNAGSNNLQSIQTTPVEIIPDAQLSFFHDYDTESGWDGGFVELSTDGGASWIDLQPFYIQNGYNSVLGFGSNTLIEGRPAFSGTSNGYIETVVDLSSFAGHQAVFRWSFGEDDNTFSTGWYVDDIRISRPFYQENTACLAFDQGPSECTSSSTYVTECINNCNPCTDGVRNGDESGVDCGGSLCSLCPCSSASNNFLISNTTLQDGTSEKIKMAIDVSGSVSTANASQVELRAGQEFNFTGEFFTGSGGTLVIDIEDCEIVPAALPAPDIKK